MKKNMLYMVLAGTMAVSLAGCGSGKNQTSGAGNVSQAESTQGKMESASESKSESTSASVSISVGFENNMKDSMSAAVQSWADNLEKLSGGSMKLVLYPDSQLGSKSDLIDSMQLGENVITVADGAFLAEYGAPDLGILYGPYLFENWDQVWKLVDSDWFGEQNAKLNDNGLQIVSANWKLGERNLFTVDPVEKPSDLSGKKIRVPNNQIQIEETNAIGATATPMGASEVYQALQTKTIDGLENVNSALLNMQWCEVAKNVYEDNHVYNMAIWVCGSDMFNNLTEEQQKWLIESADQAGLYNNELQDKNAEEIRNALVNDYGVAFHECTKEDKESLISMCEPFYANGSAYGWSDGLYEKIQGIINE